MGRGEGPCQDPTGTGQPGAAPLDRPSTMGAGDGTPRKARLRSPAPPLTSTAQKAQKQGLSLKKKRPLHPHLLPLARSGRVAPQKWRAQALPRAPSPVPGTPPQAPDQKKPAPPVRAGVKSTERVPRPRRQSVPRPRRRCRLGERGVPRGPGSGRTSGVARARGPLLRPPSVCPVSGPEAVRPLLSRPKIYVFVLCFV